jgi:hypothetical protein
VDLILAIGILNLNPHRAAVFAKMARILRTFRNARTRHPAVVAAEFLARR